MRVIALLATFNERRFIAGCLEHLHRHGVETYLLDNSSTDETVAIAKQFLGRGLLQIETVPREGVFDLRTQLERKQQLAHELEGDWFMHLDPDEIRLPPRAGITLAEAVAEVDRAGFNAVHFEEFVFIPTREAPDHDHPDFQETMRWYYPFSPFHPHRMNLWKKQAQPVDLLNSGGHRVAFPGLQCAPEHFKMRHYHFLSVAQAIEKFVDVGHAASDLQRGFNRLRAQVTPEIITLPSQSELRAYISDDELDPSHPRQRHYLGELVLAAQQARAQEPSPG